MAANIPVSASRIGSALASRGSATRFTVLDSWRGVAALFVALFHLNAYGHFYTIRLIRNSDLFVDFFFVLSGFVISHTYFDRVSAYKDLLPFMIRRFGRVWPLHAAMLAVFIAFPLSEWTVCYATNICGSAWPFHEADVRTILANLFLLQSMDVTSGLSWNWPSWSISAEFYTYLVFAIACVALRPAFLQGAITFAILGGAIVALLSKSYATATYDFGYFRCLFGFFSGVLVFALYRSNKLTLGRWGTPLEVVTLVGVGTFLSLIGASGSVYLAPLVFACCVYVFAHEMGWISRMMQSGPFLRLGAWSYSLYMVHAFILIVLLRAASGIEKLFHVPMKISMGDGPKLYFLYDRYAMDGLAILYLLAVIALASFTYRRLEDPTRRYFNGIANSIDRGKPHYVEAQ